MSVSTVPLPSTFFHAVLRVLTPHVDGVRRREIYELVADAMHLSPPQRAERLPSLTHLRYRHRIGWSLNLLKNAGLIESPTSDVWRVTSEGEALLSQHATGFGDEVTKAINRRARAATSADDQDSTLGTDSGVSVIAPEERIDLAIREMREAVAADLLIRIAQSTPAFFEELVLALLHALGYGASASDLEHVGASGDGGIDGIITLDKLGFDKVFVQAKRWQGSVGRPDIQAFFGALAGRRAKRGVFITTSTFTKDALAFGEQVSDSVVLIDGARLTELMIDHGVAVTHYRIVRLPRVDGDYFESD